MLMSLTCGTEGKSKAQSEDAPTRRPVALAARGQCYTLSFEYHFGGASVPLYEYKCLNCGRKTEKIENVSRSEERRVGKEGISRCGGLVTKDKVQRSRRDI